MQPPKLENKRVFLLASDNQALIEQCRAVIEKHISFSTIFVAHDGAEALFKVENVLPHVAILDLGLAKFDGFEVTKRILNMHADHTVSVILATSIPEKEHHVDEVITRQVQFLEDYMDENRLCLCLSRALNRLSVEENSTYRLHFLAPGEVLFNEGDKSNSVFFVKKGELEVIKMGQDVPVVIGRVDKSEFVGEMAHFNGEPRSATVRAKNDCELIEIPSDALDLVLFSKPTWAKALISTLSRRLQRSNQQVLNRA